MMSLRAYARHRGVAPSSVVVAVQSGRLRLCVVRDEKGRPKIADVAVADREWDAGTDLSRAPGYVKARADARAASTPALPLSAADDVVPPSDSQDDETPSGDTVSRSLTLSEATALEKDWKARIAELDYRERAGELVNARAVEARIVDEYSKCRTKLLAVSRKAKATMPHLTHADVLQFDVLIREALEDLAGRGAEKTESV
ncbi:MAG: hypothetical protein Q8L86_10140 [Vicinamibacterales bacterium]|nr:hypothetical protein [Vicinamibacterales bacterium]